LRRLILLALLCAAASLGDTPRVGAGQCSSWWMTGYARSDFPGLTADGTPTWTRENIVAANSLALGSYVFVPEWDTIYRVADRGHLGPNHLDFLVDSPADAYQLTGWRTACPL
jgi:3D (Asp-Asp-Asp) domain-containing protein